MVDTSRTEADLLANLFQDGQANNAITSQDMRDLIVSMKTINPEFITGLSNPAHQEGLIFYDDEHKAVSYYNEDTEVTVNIGQELVLRVINNSGVALTDGDVVFISGASTGLPEVTEAIASNNTPDIIGVVTSGMDDGTIGYTTIFGLVHSVDTSSFTAGDTLYLSTVLGGLTATAPTLPIETIIVGTAVDSLVDGHLLVHPDRVNISSDVTVIGQYRSELTHVVNIADALTPVFFELNGIEENVTHETITSDAATLAFAVLGGGDTITRAGGASDFVAEGFTAGMTIRIVGSASNNGVYTIGVGGVATTVLTLVDDVNNALTTEGAVAATIIGNEDVVTINEPGVYDVEVGYQIVQAGGGGGASVSIWVQEDIGGGFVNTTAVGTRTASANSTGFASVKHLGRHVAGDKVRVVWATDNVNGTLGATAPSAPVPLVPSIFLHIEKIGA